VSNEFFPTGDMAQGRGSHTATALDDGRVLIVGGVSERNQLLDSVEVYDPLTGMFRSVARLPDPRATHAAVRVGSGRVLVVGGQLADGDMVTGCSAETMVACE
jgi:N-acetylneuraminic acid mutarotase